MHRIPLFVVLTLLVVRCLPAAVVPITITSAPPGLLFYVTSPGCAGGSYATPQTFTWTVGTSCAVLFISPIRGWQDGVTDNPRTIVTPGQAATYSALSSTALPEPPGSYVVTQIATGDAKASGMNNYGQVVGASNQAAFLWMPAAPNGTVGSLVSPGDSLIAPSSAAGINDRGQVVGSATAVAGAGRYNHAFLWSPDAPNGTAGTVTAFLADAPTDSSSAVAVNNFGQIIGQQNLRNYIWTPSATNGTAGTLNTDSRLGASLSKGIQGINDFGQAIINFDAASWEFALFTPAVANGASGSFTAVPGLPGSGSPSQLTPELTAINASGTVLGQSCIPISTGNSQCINHGFLWIPSAPNGTTGTTAEIPLPAGYVSMGPAAINAGGQVAGTLTTPTNISFPFLYAGGTMYDLSGLAGLAAQSQVGPTAINDQGQIVFNTSAGVFLATPGAGPPAPGAGSVAVTIAVAFNPPPTASQHVDSPPFTVIGPGCIPGGYNSPQTLYWMPGSSCSVTFPSIQSMQIGARSVFQSWQDGPGGNTRVFVVPAQATTYTAVFAPQYLVTTQVTPPGAGTVSGGGWYTGGSTATLNAAPASGYRVLSWSPAAVPADAPSATVSVYAAQTITVNFETSAATAPNYLLTEITAFGSPTGINNYGQVAGRGASFLDPAFLWTPVSPNSPAGSVTASHYGGPINDSGQLIGGDPPSLWTPDTPNGTSGSATPLLGVPPGVWTIRGLNNYGQIVGGLSLGLSLPGLDFLWTPASPNGTTGTSNQDPRFASVAGINDYGQVIINSPQTATQPPTLFTSSAANGSNGTFTPLAGLPGNNPWVTAINRGGTILGGSYSPWQTFLWTPTTPNGTTGTAAAISPPPGFANMTGYALNASGQVVGTMIRADGAQVPFLYSGGTVYDLTTISAQLAGTSPRVVAPIGINDYGQIVLGDASGYLTEVYLLTPGAAPQPAPGSVTVTIAADAPLAAFTVTGSGCAAGGYVAPQTLYWTPGSNCTVTFVSPHSTDAGTRYVFAQWQDGASANPRVFVAPAQAAGYSASFAVQYLLSTAASPAAGGSISGGGWYPASSEATLTAAPASGYRLAGWLASGESSPGGQVTPVSVVARDLSAIVTVNQPESVTVRFAPAAALPPNNYQLTGIGGRSTLPGKPINRSGEVVVWSLPISGSSPNTFLWIPESPNSNLGTLTAPSGLPQANVTTVGINDRGQLAGTALDAFRWSPDTANGLSGTSVDLGNSHAYGINNYGQVLGDVGGTGFLWAPAAANGTTGTFATDSQFNGGVAINDFGQAIMNGTTSTATLFTPSTANGASGTFTPITGLAGAARTQVRDINASGTIVGTSCTPAAATGECDNHMFLWTPAAANGTAGTAVEIPMPSGALSISPSALNSSGQIVGQMFQLSAGGDVPFLYSGGTVYNLSVLYSGLLGYSAVGINDAGQIVLDRSYVGIYLLTPQAPASMPPSPLEANPGSGTGQNQVMTFTFSDPRGWQDLDVVSVLINNFLDGRNACYLAYSRTAGVLYLVDDAGTALSGGLPLNGSGSVGNSQCTVAAASSSASGNGDVLTLTLNLTFSTGFGGNKAIYLAARDVAGNSSGWQALGAWQVPVASPSTTASVVGMSPAQGGGLNGATFTFSFADTNGYQDLGVENILIASAFDGRHACYLAYDRGLNVLYLINDNGDGLLPGYSLARGEGLGNGQCSVTWGNNAVTASGNHLSLTLGISFNSPFGPNLVFYLAARDVNGGNNTGWQARGTWTVQ